MAGFDPERTKDPTLEGNRLQTSGRGLLLIRAFVDEVKFRRHRAGSMEITLVKKIRPEEAGQSGGASDHVEQGGAR